MKNKTILSIIGLLFIGFILGIVCSRVYFGYRIKNIKKDMTAKGLENRIYKIIQADEPTQTRLSPSLQPLTKAAHNVHTKYRGLKRHELDSIHLLMLGVLENEEQKERLQDAFKRMKHLGGKKQHHRSHK